MDITCGFVTKCWSDDDTKKHFLRDLLRLVDAGKVQPPDLIVMCSMLWDISRYVVKSEYLFIFLGFSSSCVALIIDRYGPDGVQLFKESLGKMVNAVKNTKNLREGVFLWMTQPPVGKKATAPFLCREVSRLSEHTSLLPCRICVPRHL